MSELGDLRIRVALKYGQGRGILLSREEVRVLYKNFPGEYPQEPGETKKAKGE
jgi:hypothetical protein